MLGVMGLRSADQGNHQGLRVKGLGFSVEGLRDIHTMVGTGMEKNMGNEMETGASWDVCIYTRIYIYIYIYSHRVWGYHLTREGKLPYYRA